MLAEGSGAARPLAGGQSLMALLNQRRLSVERLIDLNEIADLSRIVAADGVLRIGALARQRAVERSPLVLGVTSALAQASRHVASPAVRNRGTVAGSLAHADPVAEYPTALMALDASVVVRRLGGVRQLRCSDLVVGPFRTALRDDELIVEVVVPIVPRSGSAFLELAPRFAARAIVSVAAVVTLDRPGLTRGVRVAVSGVAPHPVLLNGLEPLSGSGSDPGSDDAQDMVRHAVGAVSEATDGAASWRRQVAVQLTLRALADAGREAVVTRQDGP